MGEAALALAFMIIGVVCAIVAVIAWLDARRLDREAKARADAGGIAEVQPTGVELATTIEVVEQPPRAIVRKLRRNRADLRRALGRN